MKTLCKLFLTLKVIVKSYVQGEKIIELDVEGPAESNCILTDSDIEYETLIIIYLIGEDIFESDAYCKQWTWLVITADQNKR